MSRFHRLQTRSGDVLVFDQPSGGLVFVPVQFEETYAPVFVYVPAARPDVCVIGARREDVLVLSPTLSGRGVVPLGLSARNGGSVALYDLDTGLWVCAEPRVDTSTARARLILGYPRIDTLEPLFISTVQHPCEAPALVETAAKLEAMLGRPLDLDLIRSTQSGDSYLLEAVARLATLDRLEALSKALLRSPEDCRLLSSLFPADFLGRYGLPVLADWNASKSYLDHSPRLPVPEPSQTIGRDLDDVSALAFGRGFGSMPHACTALARRAVTPNRNLCVIGTARNEGIYLVDWLAYHRAIGVEEVFLYSNDNDDGSDILLSALANAGAVRWRRNQVSTGGSAQRKAYGHALGFEPDVLDYRWALAIDIDEYLVFNPDLFGSANDFLRWHEARPCDAIALNWIFHGSNSEARWRDESVIRRFPHSSGDVDVHIKSLFRPKTFIHSTPHFPLTWRNLPFTFHAANGEMHVAGASPAISAKPNGDFAWINHYFYKSTEEFLWKWSRNRGDHPLLERPTNSALSAFFIDHFVRQFPERSIARANPEDCAPAFRDEVARLMALPGVADAMALVKQTYSVLIRNIVPMFTDAPGIIEAGAAGRALLATLDL